MKKFLAIIFSITGCIISYTSFCQYKDTIFLNNGEILIGDIKSVSYGRISIDDVVLKMVSLKLYKIEKIKTAQRFRIETDDKKIYFGALGENSKPGWVNIIPDDSATFSIPVTSITEMMFLGKNFFRRLEGDVSAGLSYTKSNGIGQVNLNASVKYRTKKLENELSLSSISSIDSSKYSRDNENVELFSTYDLTSSWSLAGLVAYQRNLELSLKHRFLEMLGAGNKLLVTKDMQLLALSGISMSQERSTTGVNSGVLFEIPAMVRFDFYHFPNPNIQIGTSQSVYFGITQAGRIRYSGSTDFSWQLIRNFYFTVNLYSNFDSKPPEGSSSKTDFGIVMGISYKF